MKNLIAFICIISFASCKNKTTEVTKVVEHKVASRFTNEKDFICEMETTNEYTDTIVVDQKVYGFCSATCLKTFKKNKDKYLNK